MTAPTAETVIPDDEIVAGLEAHFSNPLGLDEEEPEQAAADPETPATPEADQPEAGATPAADSTTAETPPEAADQPPVVDPFEALRKDAVPLAYKDHGQAKTFDGIYEVPGKGAIIPADKLEDVRNLVARYESNSAATKDLYATKERFTRLGGEQKFHELSEQNAQLNAASVLILDALTKDVLQFVRVENGQVVPNDAAIRSVVREAGLATKEALWQTRQEREQAEQTSAASQSEQEVRATAIPRTIDHTFAHYKLPATDIEEAKAFFAKYADSLVRKATVEEAQQYGFAPGQLIVDVEKMDPWFQSRAKLRQEQATEVAAREAAAKENARRLAKPPAPAPKKVKAAPRNADGTFAAPEGRKYSREDLMLRALGGAAPDD